MSFAFTVKITYKPNCDVSWQRLGEMLSQNWIPCCISSLHYYRADSYSSSQLELVFEEHDNEEFMADMIAEYLLLSQPDIDPLEQFEVESCSWSGLDRFLGSYWKSRLGMPNPLDKRSTT